MSRITSAPRAARGTLGSSTAAQGPRGPDARGPNGSRSRQALGLLVGVGAFVVGLGVACTGKDDTSIDRPDSGVSNGGSGGSSGAGGSGANGGSAGTASAGASGTGGEQPDASAGSGGSGGSAGDDAGTDAGPDDGGVNTDAGDAAPVVLTHLQVATAICAREDEVNPCPATDQGCADNTVLGWETYQMYFPDCTTIVENYFRCLGNEPSTSFDCNTQVDPNAPEPTTPQPGNCVAQDAAFQAAFGLTGDPSTCTQ